MSLNLSWILGKQPRSIKNVLIVEDDCMLKPLLARLLYEINQKAGLKWVTSVAEAQSALLEEHFDLIVTDIILEGDETGIDLQKYCIENYPDSPVVVVSSLPKSKIEEQMGYRLDNRVYLSKPIDPQIFNIKVKAAVEHRWFEKMGALLF